MKYVKPLALFRDLVKAKAKGGRLVGLDVGDKYVALAISEIDNKIASPLGILMRKQSNINDTASDFQTLAVQVKLLIDNLNKTEKLDDEEYTF